MKFNLGDRVLIKSDTNTGLASDPKWFLGHVGVIVQLPEDNSWENYGVNFGCKIYGLRATGTKRLLTHELGGFLKYPYGQFVHEDDLELFAYRGENQREESEIIMNNGDEVNALI